MEDFDRRRATELVLKDATQRMLTPEEVRDLRDKVFTADMALEGKRGVALAMIQKAENGKVLSWPESVAIAEAIERIWQEKPLYNDGQQGGVKDLDATCKKCPCRGKGCPECSACVFTVEKVGGYVNNSLSGPKTYPATVIDPTDCGCK